MNADTTGCEDGGWGGDPIALPPGEIHLWVTDYNRVGEERLLALYEGILEEGERRRRLRYHFAEDRLRDLVTRALVRSVLSRYEPLDPREWRFHLNAHGRPEIATGPGGAELVFNISHTRSLILLGVTRGGALGVDIENTRVRTAPIAAADRYFAPAEVEALAALPKDGLERRFWEHWTLKESYIKARGLGLSIPLDRFSFHFEDPDALDVSIDASLADDPSRWRFWLFSPAPCYVAAVCSERNSIPQSVRLREAIPLHRASLRTLTFIRVSRDTADNG